MTIAISIEKIMSRGYYRHRGRECNIKDKKMFKINKFWYETHKKGNFPLVSTAKSSKIACNKGIKYVLISHFLKISYRRCDPSFHVVSPFFFRSWKFNFFDTKMKKSLKQRVLNNYGVPNQKKTSIRQSQIGNILL